VIVVVEIEVVLEIVEPIVVDSQRRDFTNPASTSGFGLVGIPIATKAWEGYQF
jgi:hypothetical protein